MIRSLSLILASSSYRRFLSSILLFSFLLLILYSSLLSSFLLHSTSYPLFFSSLVFSPALYFLSSILLFSCLFSCTLLIPSLTSLFSVHLPLTSCFFSHQIWNFYSNTRQGLHTDSGHQTSTVKYSGYEFLLLSECFVSYIYSSLIKEHPECFCCCSRYLSCRVELSF